jgi:hypothetical protein
MCVPYDKTSLLVPNLLTLKYGPLKTFNIGHIFWMVTDKDIIFDIFVPYDKTFLTPYNATLEESSLCNTRSRHRGKENTLPMSLKWIFIRDVYHF